MSKETLQKAIEKALITIAPVSDNIMLVIVDPASKEYLYLSPSAIEALLADEVLHTVRNRSAMKDTDGKETKIKPLVAGQRKEDVLTFGFGKMDTVEIKSKKDIERTFSVRLDIGQTHRIVEVFREVSLSLNVVQAIVRGGKKLDDSAVSAGLDLFTES